MLPLRLGLFNCGRGPLRVQIGGVLGSNDIVYRAGAANQNNFSAVANTSCTAFVVDTLNCPRPATSGAANPGGSQFIVVTDTLTAPAANMARIRVFNLAPDALTVSVRLVNPGTSQGVAIFTQRTYQTVSGTNLRYTNIPVGSYIIQVYIQAQLPAEITTPATTTATVTLTSGKIYTIYPAGLTRNGTLTVSVVQHN